MATRFRAPVRKPAPKKAEAAAEAKQAAKESPRIEAEPLVTHQGPGTGKAGSVDPAESAAILSRSQPATVVSEAKPAAIQSATENLRARIVEDEFKLKTPVSEVGAVTAEPKTPGQQTNDSGIKTGPSVSEGGASGGRAAPGSDSQAAQLDASVDDALSRLAESRPGFGGPLDVFEAAAGSASGSAAGGQFGSSRDDLVRDSGRTADGGAEHAAGAVGQITSGDGPLLGGRLAGVNADLEIAGGLIGDQQTAASSPNAADGVLDQFRTVATFPLGGPFVDKAVDVAAELSSDVEAAFIAAEATNPGQRTALQEALAAFRGAGGGAVGAESAVNAFLGVVPPIPPLSPEQVAAGQQSSGEEPGVKDPGDPDGGLPTEAQIAFRQALRESLAARPTTGGDIDPAEDSSASGVSGAVVERVNNNESLIGQPDDGAPTGGAGRAGSSPGGTDVDPLEGSAFSGPALGGNPEDVGFGSAVLGLGAVRRTQAVDQADEDEEDDA